ncbi:caspase-2 isoform 3-T3 [Synchiropus picturatus]
MEKRHMETLQSCSVDLQKQLEVDETLLQHLKSNKILTDPQAERIMAKDTSFGRAWYLLLLLPKRGPNAFNMFCRALKETDQDHLCDMLMQQLEGTNPEMSYSDSSCRLSVEEVVPVKRIRFQESMECSLDTDSPITTPVVACEKSFYNSHHQQSYKMTSSPRGKALVISNVTFDGSKNSELGQRKGGEVDEEVLSQLFADLDYEVRVCKNLTAEGIRDCIEHFRSQPDHRRMDSCVVCLLSHGVDGAIYGSDGGLLAVSWKLLLKGRGLKWCFLVSSWTGCSRPSTTAIVRCCRTNPRCSSSKPAEERRRTVAWSRSTARRGPVRPAVSRGMPAGRNQAMLVLDRAATWRGPD